MQPASRGGVDCGILGGEKDDMGESCRSGKDNFDSTMSSDWFVFVSVDAGRGEGEAGGGICLVVESITDVGVCCMLVGGNTGLAAATGIGVGRLGVDAPNSS